MASYATALSFLLAIVLLTTLQVKARETKFFSKFNPQVDQLSPSSELNNYDGYHFNNRQSDIPTEEFIANINKGFTARDLDEHSYVTVPKDSMEKDSNNIYYPDKLKPTQGMHNMDASADSGGFELSTEENKFFNENEAMNGYETSYKNDHVKNEAQGMSDTRTLENGKYFYKPTRDNRGKGEYNEYFGNSEYKSKYDEFRPLKDFEYNHQNQVGFVP